MTELETSKSVEYEMEVVELYIVWSSMWVKAERET